MTPALEAPRLPPLGAALLTSIDDGSVLGASRQLHVLGDVLLDMAAELASAPRRLVEDVNALVDHVARTRGESSQAVVNGLERMARPFLNAGADLDEGVAAGGAALLADSVREFRSELDGWLTSLRAHGQKTLGQHRRILAYDYSSTVAQVISDLARVDHDLTVFVPEARSLDGGRKYLTDWAGLQLDVHLVPDSAMAWAMTQCDAAVVGAETLSASGGCYNTVGTAMLSREATRTGLPFYVLSILLKTDLRTRGGERLSPSMDFLGRLDPDLPPGAVLTLDGHFPDIDYAAPDDISAVVTERGAVSPRHVSELASQAGRTTQERP